MVLLLWATERPLLKGSILAELTVAKAEVLALSSSPPLWSRPGKRQQDAKHKAESLTA